MAQNPKHTRRWRKQDAQFDRHMRRLDRDGYFFRRYRAAEMKAFDDMLRDIYAPIIHEFVPVHAQLLVALVEAA